MNSSHALVLTFNVLIGIERLGAFSFYFYFHLIFDLNLEALIIGRRKRSSSVKECHSSPLKLDLSSSLSEYSNIA